MSLYAVFYKNINRINLTKNIAYGMGEVNIYGTLGTCTTEGYCFVYFFSATWLLVKQLRTAIAFTVTPLPT